MEAGHGRTIRAAGGVLWRRSGDGLEVVGGARSGGEVQVAVVHRPRYDDWSLPKGKLDDGESLPAAAVREIAEETGFSAVLGRSLGETGYEVLERGRVVPKTVQWWAARATGGEFVPGDEVDELRWLPVAQARDLLTARRDDGVLQAFASAPPDTSTVLLVRHGRAGSRADWDGPDDLRPLDDRGLAQAARLADVLPLWAPVDVLSAPPLRCVETVRPAARRLGLEVGVDEALGEASAGALPGRLSELGAAARTVIACSQGKVVPEAVASLTGGHAVEVKKGSTWALSFADGRLVDALHLDRLA